MIIYTDGPRIEVTLDRKEMILALMLAQGLSYEEAEEEIYAVINGKYKED